MFTALLAASVAFGAFFCYKIITTPDFIELKDNLKPTSLKEKGLYARNRSAFDARRLNPSTFLITEYDDIYAEHPFIYAKVMPWANTILLMDTGCGGASNDDGVDVTSLRMFIEEIGIDTNAGRPINAGRAMSYIVVLSHCHYDHILGIEDFARDSRVLASAHDASFNSPANLPNNSLCNSLNITTPSYSPTLVPHLHQIYSVHDTPIPLGVTVLHTPGHTPDELALWDAAEKTLYVGDTLYEWEPIIFPKEGSITVWLSTMEYLIAFVQEHAPDAQISCGHSTAGQPAMEVLQNTKIFMGNVLAGKQAMKRSWEKRSEKTVQYGELDARFSLICPERLIMEARESWAGSGRI